ncbi:hypothetical protein KGM_200419B, partial [Danaus plexippus plexippus]
IDLNVVGVGLQSNHAIVIR